MNRLCIVMTALIMFSIIQISAFATAATSEDSEKTIINKANDLIIEKKYETAFQLLDNFDPENNKPDIVLLKEDVALKYFVTSIMHQMFAFKDIKKDEDVLDYRGKTGSYKTHVFKIDETLESLIKKYPNNYKLYNGLGYYYFEAYSKYGINWLKNEDELIQLIEINYAKAISHNAGDAFSYYALGHLNLERQKYKEAVQYLLKSAELDNKNADVYYDLGYGYLYMDDRDNALKYAKKSLDLYTDRKNKGDAAQMVAAIYSELGDYKHEKEYGSLSNKINPGNYYTLKPLLALYIKTNDPQSNIILNSFFATAPDNPTIYNDLAEIYSNNKKINELIIFYKTKLPEYKSNKKALGNLNFYLGQLYLYNKDKKNAKEYFVKAKEIFATVYSQDHQVFEEINRALEDIN